MPLRVRVIWSGSGGTPFLSTHYFSGGAQSDADDAVTAVGTFWGAVDGLIDSSISWATDAEVVEIAAGTGAPQGSFATTPATGTGAVSGTANPWASQGLIRWRTGVFIGGREVRGRTFVPGMTQVSGSDGVPAAATITTLNNAAAALIADANSVLLIWSKTHGVEHAVTSGSAWNQFAILRGRRPGF
jgi:hypothetical protein